MLLYKLKGSACLKDVRMAALSFCIRLRSSASVLHDRIALMSDLRLYNPALASSPPRRGSKDATCCCVWKKEVIFPTEPQIPTKIYRSPLRISLLLLVLSPVFQRSSSCNGAMLMRRSSVRMCPCAYRWRDHVFMVLKNAPKDAMNSTIQLHKAGHT